MPTKLETQAAEARCLHVSTPDKIECKNCQGQESLDALKYPTLSRVCPGVAYMGFEVCRWFSRPRPGYPGKDLWERVRDEGEEYGPPPTCDCDGHNSGRIPDCSLEKLCTIVDTLKVDLYCDGWQAWIIIEDNDWSARGYGTGDTPLEAALAALLSSETPATPARKPPTPE